MGASKPSLEIHPVTGSKTEPAAGAARCAWAEGDPIMTAYHDT
jgi:hypothetical protein